jgi:F-type H+-transporting ATPase subunit epsilon
MLLAMRHTAGSEIQGVPMSLLHVAIVTIERLVYDADAEMVLLPSVDGQLGILPKHTPLITRLTWGELRIRKGGHDEVFAVSGGFVEVLPDRVTVLADTAERADEIDVQRAAAARARAADLMQQRLGKQEFLQAEAALRRSLVRLRVSRHAGRRPSGGGPLAHGKH